MYDITLKDSSRPVSEADLSRAVTESGLTLHPNADLRSDGSVNVSSSDAGSASEFAIELADSLGALGYQIKIGKVRG